MFQVDRDNSAQMLSPVHSPPRVTVVRNVEAPRRRSVFGH
jgi:hypothetical protein